MLIVLPLKFDIEQAQRQLRSLGDPSIVSESTILSEEYRRMEAHEQQAYEIIMDELGELENRSFLKLRELNEAMNDNPAENGGAEGDDIDEGIEDEGSHEDPNEDIIDESDNDEEGSLSDKATNTEEPVKDDENQHTIQEEEEEDDQDEVEESNDEKNDEAEEDKTEDNEEETNEDEGDC